jgi:cellulose biosynthesis protein BcsQ
MPKQIDIIINGKGGVGKSFFAVNFIQFLKDHSIPHTAIDTDNENSTLKRFHRETSFLDIRDPKEIDTILSSLEETDLVVVDCRAASTDIFLDYFDELQIFEMLETMGASLTVISPVNHETDSLEQIHNLSERLGDRCRYVIVKNRALTEHFRNYEQSKTRARLVEELIAREIVMQKLYDWLVADLNLKDLTVTAGVQHPEFTLMDRQRLKNWQRTFYDEIESVKDFLLPQTSKTRRTKTEAKPAPPAV